MGDDGARLFDVADELLASGRVVKATMMGHRCLRLAPSGAFVDGDPSTV